jgi:DNA-binding SARP family transcriptional activator
MGAQMVRRLDDDRGGVTRVNLLRGFHLYRNRARVDLPPRAQRLIAFVALKAGVLQRCYVSGTLWMDYNQDAANANLRTARWRLRQLSHPLIVTSPTQVSLSPDVLVDVREAMAVADRVATSGSNWHEDDLNSIAPAGELLPDWYDDWIVFERERFRGRRW